MQLVPKLEIDSNCELSQKESVIGDLAQVVEGGALTVQAVDTWQQSEATPGEEEKHLVLYLEDWNWFIFRCFIFIEFEI